MYSNNRHIGVFDSGVGGLTVLKSLIKELPDEKFIYFGDTKNLPYGDKTKKSIIELSDRICKFLIDQNCKAIVIACNSASANAYEYLKEKYNNIPIVDVITPTVNFTLEKKTRIIGVIATKTTIKSNIYESKITRSNKKIKVCSLATPLLVNFIEEGFLKDLALKLILEKYLHSSKLRNIDSLILGCTHYPILQKEIKAFYSRHNKKVNIIDSARATSKYLKEVLIDKKLLKGKDENSNLKNKFYISDYSDTFSKVAKIILHREIEPEIINI